MRWTQVLRLVHHDVLVSVPLSLRPLSLQAGGTRGDLSEGPQSLIR
jgi:hypothetical protein